MPLTILSASAGSGKTYRLSREYVAVCLSQDDPSYAGTLLAMTFTNKATAEMKERILLLLKQILDDSIKINKTDPLYPVFTTLGEAEFKIRAEKVLKYLLKNYHNFNVSTLDSFFQSIIRQFQHELSMDNPYKVELNYPEVLRKSIAHMLDKLESGSKEFTWIMDWITDNLKDGKDWDVRNELQRLGFELLKEGIADSWYSLDLPALESVYQDMRKYTESIDQQFRSNQEQLQLALDHFSLNPEDFAYGKSGFVSSWLSKNNIFELNGSRFLSDAENLTKWYSNKTPENIIEKIEASYERVQTLRHEVISTQEVHQAKYKSYKAVLQYFRNYVTLRFLHQALQEYCRLHDILLLSEANRLVSRVIADADMSILYEKSGQKFLQLMVDEFQDTSQSQWNNIRPLIENGLSENRASLIVGDIKQAIYRWRNGDWRLMHHQVAEDLHHFDMLIRKESLDKNWRSAAVIVEFNNQLFANAVSQLTQFILAPFAPHPLIQELPGIYEDVRQQVTKDDSFQGSVQINILKSDAEPEDEESEQKLFQEKRWIHMQLNHFFDLGFNPSDICILVRVHNQAAQVMAWMDEWDNKAAFSGKFKAVSEKGYLMKNNDAVQFLIYALRLRLDPANSAFRANLIFFWARLQGMQHVTKPFWNPDAPQQLPASLHRILDSQLMSLSLWMSTLIRELELQPNEPAFLSAFLDMVREFELTEGNEPYEFPVWWENRVDNSGIPSNKSLEAIQVMTVHKSKGLQFPVLLIPFTDSKLIDIKTGEIIYVTHKEDVLLNKLGKVPIPMSKHLKDSWFEEDWKQECILKAIDSLNMLYVATTRAEQHLSMAVCASQEKSNSAEHTAKLSQLILSTLPENGLSSADGYIYGDINALPWTNSVSEEISTYEVPNLTIRSSTLRTGVWLDKELPASPESESGPDRRSLGVWMHEALARMKDKSKVEQVLTELKLEGIIPESEVHALKKVLLTFLDNPIVGEWYKEDQSYFAEKEIIEVDGKSYRPDRVLIYPEKTILIDFKTGKSNSAYHKQLRQYRNLLERMHLPVVEAYLAYLDPVHIEKLPA